MGNPRYSADEYYMNMAIAVRKRANCLGRRVGAVIVKDNRVVSTGYNGTPDGLQNCDDGGCRRCANPEQFEAGIGYDFCLCVHAEQNAILSAARFGIAIEGSTFYTTLRPCFNCTKEMLQAKITKVIYLHEWQYPSEEIQEEYILLQTNFVEGIQRLDFIDPEEKWANTTR